MIDAAAMELESQRRGNHAALVHEFASWPAVRADLIRRTGLGRQETNIVAHDHSLLLNIRGIANDGQNYLDGRRVGFHPRPPGTLCFIPAGHSWAGWDDGEGTASYLFVAMKREFVLGLLEKMPGPSHVERLVPNLGFQDPEIQLAARRINSEIKNQDTTSILVVESQAAIIVAQLLRRSAERHVHVTGGLAPSVLNRAIERIEASLEHSIRLTELAADAGLSAHHFCRAFRQSTGLPPHAYLIQRRLDRACDLLRSSNMSITEIALMCGYSSGSHLSASFQKEIGVSPKMFRGAWQH
jgi:AraC-like DNA-binding protein